MKRAARLAIGLCLCCAWAVAEPLPQPLSLEQALIEMDFRDLNLDQARTLYELEARADLGNNMAEFSAARLRRAQAEYQLARTWAEVALLTGHPEWDPFTGQGDS